MSDDLVNAICGIDCKPRQDACNGYCVGKADRPPLIQRQDVMTPQGSNADEWLLFITEHSPEFVAVQIAERLDEITALRAEVRRWQNLFDEKHNLMLEQKARAERAEAALATARRDAPSPMSSAPKDGTPVLVRIKDDLSAYGVKPGDFGNTHAFCGLYAVMRCRDDIMGWSFAAPVGRGGFSEEWLDGWWPLPLEAASVDVTVQDERIPDHAAWAARGRWREAYEALRGLSEASS